MDAHLCPARPIRFGVYADWRLPPALHPEQQALLKAVIAHPPEQADVPQANWTWRGVQEFVCRRFGLALSWSSCLRYLHRLGFVWKRPKKRLDKADATKRAAFMQEYATRCAQADSKHFFVDEAHFRADADLRGKWTPRGQPALVDSTSPRLGDKVTYYSAVCLETGEVQALALDGYSSPEASVTFPKQLRAATSGPLVIFWDNSPAHGGEPLRHYLTTPKLQMQLVKVPPYSPDYNADEAIWEWARKDVTANTRLGTVAKVRERLDAFFAGLHQRAEEVKQRCQAALQTEAAARSKMQGSPGH